MRRTGNPRIDNGRHPVIIGSDEAGWGAMAGPLVVAAVALPRDFEDRKVEDSKEATEAQREAVYDAYKGKVTAWVEIVAPDAFDRMGPWSALLYAHRTSLQKVVENQSGLAPWPLVVVDGNLPVDQFGLSVEDVIAMPKADGLVAACSMASIFAKVTRDRLMKKLDGEFPGYGFAESYGYVTSRHTEALHRLGPCPLHRRTFGPVQEVLAEIDAAAQRRELWTIFDDE